MAIEVGDSIPDTTLRTMADEGPREISASEIFTGKKVGRRNQDGQHGDSEGKFHHPVALSDRQHAIQNRDDDQPDQQQVDGRVTQGEE